MIEKSLEQIGEADLHELVARSRAEGRRLDYKLTLPGRRDEDAKEFLADLTSFANTDGGDIIIGIRDENGTAAEIVGITSDNLDGEILRLENWARDCLDPRLPSFRIHSISLDSGQAVLVLRIAGSLIAPHRVSYKGSSRFFSRNSRGKSEMDTNELRLAFAATDEMPRKMRDLHTQAVAASRGKDMPFTMPVDVPVVVLTFAPLSVLREPRDIKVTREEAVLPPLVSGYDMVVGLDGLIVYSRMDREANTANTWSMNHRKGYVDCAWTIGRTVDGMARAWPKYFEEQVPGAIVSSMARLHTYGIEGPWVAMATIRSATGYRLMLGDHYYSDPAWRDEAYLGEIIDEVMNAESIQPFIENFWRLFGIDDVARWR